MSVFDRPVSFKVGKRGGKGVGRQGAKNNERFSGNAGPRKGNRAKMATLFFFGGKRETF